MLQTPLRSENMPVWHLKQKVSKGDWLDTIAWIDKQRKTRKHENTINAIVYLWEIRKRQYHDASYYAGRNNDMKMVEMILNRKLEGVEKHFMSYFLGGEQEKKCPGSGAFCCRRLRQLPTRAEWAII